MRPHHLLCSLRLYGTLMKSRHRSSPHGTSVAMVARKCLSKNDIVSLRCYRHISALPGYVKGRLSTFKETVVPRFLSHVRKLLITPHRLCPLSGCRSESQISINCSSAPLRECLVHLHKILSLQRLARKLLRSDFPTVQWPRLTQQQALVGLFLGVAVVVAGGRITIRYSQIHRITIDDGFFYLAILTLIVGTIMLYLDLPYVFLVEDVEAGLRTAPAGMSHSANIPKLL